MPKLAYARDMSGLAAKTLVLGGIIFAIIIVGFLEARKGAELDELVRDTLRQLGMNRTYGMRAETRVDIGDRILSIDGTYRIDTPAKSYSSNSRTTLTVKNTGETHSFTLQNISLGEKVYVSVSTDSPLLRQTLPLTEGWRSFDSRAIPEEFVGIAVYGPILDNTRIFADEGAHLTFLEKKVEDSGEQYVFKLSNPRDEIGGTLQTLFERIGSEGRVFVWLREGRVSHFVFTGKDYVSTTTLMGGELDPITPPL